MVDTISESVVWTLCPNGRDKSGNLHLSAFIAPRLTVDPSGKTTLATPTAWRDWPAVLKTCDITVVVPGKPDAPRPLKRKAQYTSDVYTALFPKSTPVISFNTKTLDSLKSALILSYPVKALADHIEQLYTAIAAAPTEDMPKAKQLIQIGWPGYRSPTERRQSLATGATGKGPTHQDRLNLYRSKQSKGLDKDIKSIFEAFSLYHTPLLAETTMTQQHFTAADPKALKAVPPKAGVDIHPTEATWPGFVHPKLPMPEDLSKITDFHKIAAGLSNYYQLSRLCGFVVDFVMTADAAKGLDAMTPLAFQVLRNKVKNPADTCATTDCVLGTEVFVARDLTNDHDRGFVRMHNAGLDLVQLDVDGAAHKAAALGSSLERMTITNFSDNDSEAMPRQDDMVSSTPSLRSAGLMLARTGRGADVTARAQRNAALHGSAVPELVFGDLLRGYRADIKDTSETDPHWRSLHRRNITYTFRNAVKNGDAFEWTTKDGTTIGRSPEEEGAISTSAGSSPDGSVPDVFTLHEGVFVWRGWSLSAPEPFKLLRHRPDPDKDPTDHESMIGDNAGEVPHDMPLQTRFDVALDPKGSLPKLRFGHTYSVRLRTVDLCGNSVAPTATSFPALETDAVPYWRYEPIESPVITLVGKADFGQLTCGWKDCEYPLQGESMTLLALRTYNAVYNDATIAPSVPAVHRNMWPPRVTQRFAEQHGVLDDKYGKLRPDLYPMLCRFDVGFTGTEIPASDAIKGAAPLPDPYTGQTTHYAVSDVGRGIPYLSDPLAVGVKVRLLSLEGGDWKDVFVPFYDSKLDFETVAKQVWDKDGPLVGGITIEGSEKGDFHFDGPSRTLTAPMPRACRQRLRLSFMVPQSKIDLMAIWGLMTKTKATDAVKAKILAGRHWMFTPWRELELVHAVQKPLEMPAFIGLASTRAFGATDVDMLLVTPVDGPSTVRLDVNATWNEPDDNSVAVDTKTHPLDRPYSQQVEQLPIARRESMGGSTINRAITHHFQDTRARRVTYTMDAISRFREFFELPLRDSETDMKITSQPHVQWVKSSARPPAPVVLYAIPTFGWFNENGDVKASRRTGGIRVWLDRPWLVTGYNEMLAVILPDEKAGVDKSDNANNLPFVTQWGRDPVWLSGEIKTNSPARSNFPLAKLKGPIVHPGAGLSADDGDVPDVTTVGLQVPKQPGTFAVAPHQVGFDADRQLWYADIVVDIPKDSYFPFIRLAVARYQPTSLTSDDNSAMATAGDINLHLSAPVTCDFMQISPDRVAVAVPTRNNAVRVAVFGDTAQTVDNNGAAKTRPNVIRIRTQVLDDGADQVAGWRDAVGKPSAAGPIKDDTSGKTARFVAGRLMARDLVEPVDGHRVAAATDLTDLTVSGAGAAGRLTAAPNVLFDQVVFMPDTPPNGRRRILVTESEVYPHLPAGNHEEDPVFAERIIYAEGLEV